MVRAWGNFLINRGRCKRWEHYSCKAEIRDWTFTKIENSFASTWPQSTPSIFLLCFSPCLVLEMGSLKQIIRTCLGFQKALLLLLYGVDKVTRWRRYNEHMKNSLVICFLSMSAIGGSLFGSKKELKLQGIVCDRKLHVVPQHP